MFRKSHYIAVGVVAVLALILLNLPGRVSARLKLAVGGLFLPLFGLVSSSHQFAAHAADTLTPRSALVRQNEALRRENGLLRQQLVRAQEIERENGRLRQLLGWREQSPWKSRLKPANVILWDPANWWRSVQIDLGSRDGVSTNLPVLAADGALVGRVAAVSLTHSQVVLVGDPNCRVSAIVENTARDAGVLGASGPLDRSLADLGFLPPNANLKPGQNVVTSGYGGFFPKGIPIGKIVDVSAADYGLATEARVKLAANLESLEEVWVLMP
jgi:rod shape-determining protein MreC